MRVSLISASLVLAFISLANADEWDERLMFCARKALAVAGQDKCRWTADACYEKNEKHAANVSKFMCTSTFNMRKLSEFCCNTNLDELREIARAAERSRRRRSKAHQKEPSSN